MMAYPNGVQQQQGYRPMSAYPGPGSPPPAPVQHHPMAPMPMHHFAPVGPPPGFVSQEEYDHLHRNFRLAAERAESRRVQMLEQEKQVASLRRRIQLLEGADPDFASALAIAGSSQSAMSVDDYSIGKQSGALERSTNRWAADTVARMVSQSPTGPRDALAPLAEALYDDLGLVGELQEVGEQSFLWKLREGHWMHPSLRVVVTGLLRHAVGEMITDGVVNELVVTSNGNANTEITKIHENLFVREPLVAAVWRRQTFSAAVDTIDPSLALSILEERLCRTYKLLSPSPMTPDPALSQLLIQAYVFSRMLHASGRTGSLSSAEGSSFFKAFTPEVGSPLEPGPIELVKRCGRAERGQPERVGCCVFPGLVKVQAVDMGGGEDGEEGTGGAPIMAVGLEPGKPGGRRKRRETRQVVVKRALVICECALELTGLSSQAPHIQQQYSMLQQGQVPSPMHAPPQHLQQQMGGPPILPPIGSSGSPHSGGLM